MYKENLKPNIMEAPTLFVGVGGTGCDIVTRVAKMCRPEEMENISFVGLDTNVNDLSSIERSGANVYTIQTSNTQTVGDYLDYDKDALKNWFPKNAVMYDKTVSEGAGQVRAISRLALNATIKTGRLAPLYEAIDVLFRKDGKKMRQVLRIVMASTASGGTGSGIILPLSMIIRDYVKNKYPQASCIVRAIIVLPEALDSVIKSSAERESQRRNAYATIKEINAFMMGGSGFFDVDDSLKRYKGLHVDVAVPGIDETKSLSMLPFDFCFLLDGQNAEDSTLIDLEQYKAQAAQALYEQNVGPMQRRAFSMEDNIIKEMSNPGNFGRNRFGGIGASVLRYPYMEVSEYIAYGWAMDSIGGQGHSAKWMKYDNEYGIKMREARKKGLDAPVRSVVYNDTMNAATDSFSREIRNVFLLDAADRTDSYFEELGTFMEQSLFENNEIAAARNAAAHLGNKLDYTIDKNRGSANANLMKLRAYESNIEMYAAKIAGSTAEAVFMNETKTINAREPYTLEFLLHNAYGEICHPNAARYILYDVKNRLFDLIPATEELIGESKRTLQLYSNMTQRAATFDVKKSRKQVESNIDDYVRHEGTLNDKYDDTYYTDLNKHFQTYYRAIENYGSNIAKLNAYRIGYEFVSELCTAYEQFFATFTDKVEALVRKQEDIVDFLEFRKGDSVRNVCASVEMLNELALTTKEQSSEGALLDKELNGQIFDAVKANVAFTREIRNADIVEEDKRVDIFDDILLGYFCRKVRESCNTIDLNIIEALAMENRLKARIAMREYAAASGESGKQLIDQVTHEENERYIKAMIEEGRRLASPGIQSIRNEEPRILGLCAYNNTLLDMRSFRIKELLTNSDPTDTVSKYELHFFNAMYNITPDKLRKFACYNESETGKKGPGLYHNAYMQYAKDIGPDSTKNMVISTHIDKRWDSLAVLPELDFGFQKQQMMKIHQAMIYGLIYRAIDYRKYSLNAGRKKVFKYETSEERMIDMIVSNGTLCDEFYEVLDSLYISSAIVEDIEKIKAIKRKKDSVRNSNYVDTVFAKELKAFSLDSIHEGPASLFEIPLAYYNSLPNSRRFTGEIASIVDAVVKTFEDELMTWENPTDARFLLCDLLREQFVLLLDNFRAFKALNNNTTADENPVIDTIYRKVKSVLSGTPEPDDYAEMLEELKAKIKG